MRLRPLSLGLALLALAGATHAAWNTLDGSAPIVIGHRGASGYLPEHTLESYKLAIQLGVQYIEPDLVMTKDGHLIARHEPMLGGTTNVSTLPQFASYKTTKIVDNQSVTDWFASDFTLAEIKQLRAVQPNPLRSQGFNNLYQIPTLDEVIALAKTDGAAAGRTVGIYPELKHSTFHASLFGANVFENALVARLDAAGWNHAGAPVYIQSFESSNLQYLNGITNVKLVQLMDAWDVNPDGSMDVSVPPFDRPYDFTLASDPRTFADLVTAAGLDFVKTYADGIGPWKPYLLKTEIDGVDRNGDGVLDARDRRVIGSTGVVEAAHQRGLLVHTWTFRNDNIGYQLGYATPTGEYQAYYTLGVDGLFSDFPDTAVAALAAIPEPQTYALMLAGLAAVGAMARRRMKRS